MAYTINPDALATVRANSRKAVYCEMCLTAKGIPLMRVYGGITDGVQIMEFESEDERMEAFTRLYMFYTSRLGKTVRLSSPAVPRRIDHRSSNTHFARSVGVLAS